MLTKYLTIFKIILEIYIEYTYATKILLFDILCDFISLYYIHKKYKIQNSVIEMMKISILFITTQFSMYILNIKLFIHTIIILTSNIFYHILLAKYEYKKDNFEICSKNEIEFDKNCAICLETLLENSITKLQCKHVYHIECLKQSCKYSELCPTCREIINK
jgi:hypothetical protein